MIQTVVFDLIHQQGEISNQHARFDSRDPGVLILNSPLSPLTKRMIQQFGEQISRKRPPKDPTLTLK